VRGLGKSNPKNRKKTLFFRGLWTPFWGRNCPRKTPHLDAGATHTTPRGFLPLSG
jgi:hypothetical protein